MCHLCGYLGRTKSISIEKNGYPFLRHLPPASGALPVNQQTHYVRACHLCVLLLDKQRELNHTSTNFFFKGFFRSTGATSKSIPNSIDEEEPPLLEITATETISRPMITEPSPSSRSNPPPLRRTSPYVPSTNQ